MSAWGRWLGSARARGDDRFGRWLTGAIALHAGGLLSLAAWAIAAAPPDPLVAPPGSSLPGFWIDLRWNDAPPKPDEPQPSPEGLPVRARARASAKAGATAAASNTAARAEASSDNGELSPPADTAPLAGDALPLGTPARRLSLAQLGIGVEGPAFPLDLPAPPSDAASLAEQRLNDSLSTALALGDGARGLGIEGPAVRAVTELAMDGALPLATTARLLLVVDAAGATTSVSLLEVGADRAEWQRIAEALRERLAAHALRVPAGSTGARLQLVVTSQPLSTSGGRPALDAAVFGKAKPQPGEPSAGRVSLLPRQAAALRAQFPMLEGSHPQPMAGFSNNIASAGADLSDLGRGVRRHVSARLAHLDVHRAVAPRPLSTTPPAAP